MSVTIRRYRTSDCAVVGRLIADTFRQFNLSYAPPDEQERLLGPFRYAWSHDPDHQRRIAEVIDAPVVLVAEVKRAIVGILRGRPGRLHSLFVREACQRRGIGSQLVSAFERELGKVGSERITLQSTLNAVPFYEKLGYRRSTGVRSGPCFEGTGFRYQPMKKTLSSPRPTPARGC
jgi:putative acetyltransferase